MKFLGLIWDEKLTFKKHLSELKAKCQKPLALLRSITSLRCGADQKLMKMIYNAQVRSRLDYGCIVYILASETNLKLISSIPTEALRIITGAFKTTTISTLHVFGFEMPLELRREHLAMQYFYKICSYLDNPACAIMHQLQQRRLYENKTLPLPFSIRMQKLIEEAGLVSGGVKPYFSYIMLDIKTPTWSIEPPSLNTKLA